MGGVVKEAFLDANVILRYLLNDIPEQADAVDELLKEAEEGKILLRTTALVIAEIVWTCESYYELPKEEIRDKVLAILSTPGLEVENAELLAEAAILYVEKNVDFIDAYNACWAKREGIRFAYTFDLKHFRRFDWLKSGAPKRPSRKGPGWEA